MFDPLPTPPKNEDKRSSVFYVKQKTHLIPKCPSIPKLKFKN